ncbi:glycosyltransferase family 2 protein [Bordetella sp. 02P26C-1]|uniref:glycosyltransferase family 2 protein n=1 Tax=Bordetella sp. 02P26C-1 TaxID=2683195 RepID=UPI001F26F527|nr:glycosyltransferase [Bordetella sp. 02P26C-1]
MSFKLRGGRVVDLDILIPRSGRILEIVSVPDAIEAVKLQGPSDTEQVLDLSIELRRLTWVEYRLRQLRRAVPVFFRQPVERRLRAGFRVRTLITDLDYAYGVACRFRANAYMRSYADWYAEFYRIAPEDRQAMRRRLAKWSSPPQFQIVVLARNGRESASVLYHAGLDKQIYPHFTAEVWPENGWIPRLVAASRSAHAIAPGASKSPGDKWVIILREGNRLAEAALYWLAHVIDGSQGADVVYADHDEIGVDGRLCDPAFKPDWSPELLRATNYMGDAFTWRLRDVTGFWDSAEAQRYSVNGALHSLLLALAAEGREPVHVPAPLWHIRHDNRSADPTDGEETREIVQAHLAAHGVTACVAASGPHRCRVRYALPDALPLVSIIIPTRDGLEHLQRCIESLMTLTSYPRYEIIVVDNQSVVPETLKYLGEIARASNVRVLPFDEAFNYSKINNYAVAQSNGELVCLLNNDTEVISPDWLDEMVGRLLQEGVGAVGAKLLYGNDTVQHGGDTVGPGGCANHLHSGIGRDDPGYCGRALVAQDLSAVTAACLLTKKSVYQALDGLNEVQLTVAFNDVDYCLRVREAGYRVVWTPHALLYHHESVTRGKDTSPDQIARARAEVEYMRTRWAHLMHHDPFYNPNLNYQHPDFGLSGMPNVQFPWSMI